MPRSILEFRAIMPDVTIIPDPVFPEEFRRDIAAIKMGGPAAKLNIALSGEPTVIGRRASIGSNVTILCGVTIGEEAVVGAGSDGRSPCRHGALVSR